MEKIKIKHTIWVHYLTVSRKAFALLFTFVFYSIVDSYLTNCYECDQEHAALLLVIPFYLILEYLLTNLAKMKAETDRFSKEISRLKDRFQAEEEQYLQMLKD